MLAVFGPMDGPSTVHHMCESTVMYSIVPIRRSIVAERTLASTYRLCP
jgi:hypothetical protein